MASMADVVRKVAGAKSGGSKIMKSGGLFGKLAQKIAEKGGKKSKSSGGMVRKAMTKMRKGVDSPVKAAMENAEMKKRKRKGYGLGGGGDK